MLAGHYSCSPSLEHLCPAFTLKFRSTSVLPSPCNFASPLKLYTRNYLSGLCIQILQQTTVSAIQPQCLPKPTRHLPTTMMATTATPPQQRNHVCRLPLHPKDNALSMTIMQPLDTSCILYVFFFSLLAMNELPCMGLP
jgi:hypothetical protein